MIIEDKSKSQSSSQPSSVPSGSSTMYAQSVLSDDNSIAPPPYTPTPTLDPHVDLLEGEDDDDVVLVPRTPSRTPTSPVSLPGRNVPPHLPRQNGLRVHRDDEGFRDTYVIDPSLPCPPGSHDKALSLYSKNGSVDGTVYLTGRGFKGRVQLEALSLNGSVKFSVAEIPPGMHIEVVVQSHNGSVALFLPPNFQGPLTIEHDNGVVAFAPELKARTRTLDETATRRRCWVGDWGSGPDWEGDECSVGSHNGSLKIGYWDPEQAGKTQQLPVGFLRKTSS